MGLREVERVSGISFWVRERLSGLRCFFLGGKTAGLRGKFTGVWVCFLGSKVLGLSVVSVFSYRGWPGG